MLIPHQKKCWWFLFFNFILLYLFWHFKTFSLLEFFILLNSYGNATFCSGNSKYQCFVQVYVAILQVFINNFFFFFLQGKLDLYIMPLFWLVLGFSIAWFAGVLYNRFPPPETKTRHFSAWLQLQSFRVLVMTTLEGENDSTSHKSHHVFMEYKMTDAQQNNKTRKLPYLSEDALRGSLAESQPQARGRIFFELLLLEIIGVRWRWNFPIRWRH